MRTVTFSDLSIARRVHESCVPVWVNVDPGFHDCQGAAEARIWSSEPEIFPTRNIVTFFATPDFRVLHYVAGYWHPTFFSKELEFVDRLRGDVLRGDGTTRVDAVWKVRRAHLEREKELRPLVQYFESERGWSAALGPDPVHEGHAHGPSCHSNLLQGLHHLADVHRSMIGQTRVFSTLPRLSQLFQTYRFGNPFAEGDFGRLPGRDVLAAMTVR